jgi:CBS domain-containing protein
MKRAIVGERGAMTADHLPQEVLDDVVDLLAACPAFIGVGREMLVGLAAEAEIAYVDRITAPTMPALVVQRGGLVVRDGAERTVDLVGTGEFSAPVDGERLDPIEPSMVVWLPDRAIDLAWSAARDQLTTVLDRPTRTIDLQTAAVRTVMRTPVHTAHVSEPCVVVARRMTDLRISSIVVLGDARIGIVTDRDLRSRLVAEDRSPSTPIGEIATYDVRTVTAQTPVFEALIEMLAAGIHHLPVTEDRRLVGMLSSNDVLELGTRSPFHLRMAIDRAATVDDVAAALDGLPDAVRALLAAGTTAGDVGRVVATVTDRVQRRLLGLAFAERGEPPGPFGWIAFGSQARREQTLHSDQDHGLLLSDDLDDSGDAWWRDTAAWAVAALERCGYERCNGGVMAVNAGWRHDVSGWRRAFSDWIERPSEKHLMDSTIAFDLRTVTGALQVRELLAPVIATAADHGIFMVRLARDAIRHRPPLGFFGRFAVERSGEHKGSFDIKAGVMLPIADIARLYALGRASTEVATDARLVGAVDAGQLSDDLATTLRDGYELAIDLRLRRHLECVEAGATPDNWLNPDSIEALARAQLRATFKAIRTAQQSIEARYQTGMLG